VGGIGSGSTSSRTESMGGEPISSGAGKALAARDCGVARCSDENLPPPDFDRLEETWLRGSPFGCSCCAVGHISDENLPFPFISRVSIRCRANLADIRRSGTESATESAPD